MAASILADAPFNDRYTVTYELESDAQTGTDSATGNPTFTPSSSTLLLSFAPYRFDSLRMQEGADAELVKGRGELINPLTFPTGIKTGSEFAMTYLGVAGILKITNIIPNDLPVDFGDAYQGEWRPS